MNLGKRGELLAETVIFLVLNGLVIGILLMFIALHGGGKAILAENTAKEIALIIDASAPETEIVIDLKNLADEKAESFQWENTVRITRNSVSVQLDEKTKASYTFFNNAKISANPASPTSYKIRVDEKT